MTNRKPATPLPCRMCRFPVYEGNAVRVARRVERRSPVSGRPRGFDILSEIQHLDCSSTPEARREKAATVREALAAAGVIDDPRARALLRSLGETD